MKIIDLEQGTDAWKTWRLQGVGGSDAPVIYGNSPYRSPLMVFCEKKGLPYSSDEDDKEFIFARGHATEKIVRKLFLELTGVEMKPTCIVHAKFEHIRASLDGFDPKKYGVLESKLVGAEVLRTARASGTIPEHHFTQIQHELEVADADLGHWFGHDGKKSGITIEVRRDREFIKRLLEKEHAFWELVKSGVRPPLGPLDYLTPDDETLLGELRAAKEHAENAKFAFEDLKERAIAKYASLKHPKIAGGGVKLFEVERRGSIDYMAIPEIQKVIDRLKPDYIEEFRKTGSISWTVTIDKAPKKVG